MAVEVRSRYRSERERIHIVDRLREKASIPSTAAELGRSPSTVSRENRRNGTDGTDGTRKQPPVGGASPCGDRLLFDGASVEQAPEMGSNMRRPQL